LALKLADYTVTEAGFGADLGAEKFFDIKCRMAGLNPSAVVLVATVRALKYHGGVSKDNLKKENCAALRKGICNLKAHLENIAKFGLPAVVALNRFETDTDAEIELVRRICAEAGVEMAVSELFAKGGDGGLELAEKVVKACEMPNQFHYLYTNEMSIRKKIETIATEIYGASGVQYDDVAKSAIKAIEALDPINSTYPVCMAKTQYSLSDNPALIGRPTDYNINIRDVRLSAGARFIVVLTGAVMTMPGLPKKPAANIIDIDDDGNISGLF
jgi:formate--tetrahydrofolate ligase